MSASSPTRPGGHSPTDGDEILLSPPARLRLFGFEPTEARVDLVRRGRSWRVTRTLLILLATIGIVPLVALIPPHLPWALAVIGIGAYLARSRWRERYSLRGLEAECPRCGVEQALPDLPTALESPHGLSCPGCHQDLLLEVDLPLPPQRR